MAINNWLLQVPSGRLPTDQQWPVKDKSLQFYMQILFELSGISRNIIRFDKKLRQGEKQPATIWDQRLYNTEETLQLWWT